MNGIPEVLISIWSVLKTFEIKDLIDIIAVTFIIYNLFKILRETRAIQLIKGTLLLLIIYFLAFQFQFTMLTSLLRHFFEFSVILIMIIFQPEIRRMLEKLGRSKIQSQKIKIKGYDKVIEKINNQKKHTIDVVCEAVGIFSKEKVGALIIFERTTRLGDITKTGTIINAIPSVALLGNIFFNKAPLHDGATIIKDGLVHASGCFLRLTENKDIDVNLGTRHRAALGMSEDSDAVVVVVSEETGNISIALNGKLTRNYTVQTLKTRLYELICNNTETSIEKPVLNIFSLLRKERKYEQNERTEKK